MRAHFPGRTLQSAPCLVRDNLANYFWQNSKIDRSNRITTVTPL